MIFGESGIFACSPPDRLPVWQATRKLLEWPNGATAQVFSAHDPQALRGPQFDAAWAFALAQNIYLMTGKRISSYSFTDYLFLIV